MIIGLVLGLAGVSALTLCLCTDAFSTLAWLYMLPLGFAGGFLLGVLLAFLFLWLICSLVKMDVPQDHDSKFYRPVIGAYADFIMTVLLTRIRKEGLEKLPKDGRFLLVCNHLFDLDPVVLLGVFKHSQLAFISKRENDKKFLVGPALHKLMGQPINRENDREALKTILNCVRILQEDKASIAVFPEGYTSRDNLLHPFRSGVFKIAQKAKVPIVVCTLQNTRSILNNAMRLKVTDIPLHLLAVIPPEEYQGLTTVELANRVHDMMAQDLGPENVLQA